MHTLARRAMARGGAPSTRAISSLKGRDLLCLQTFERDEINLLLDTAAALKKRLRRDPRQFHPNPPVAPYTPLVGESMAMLFQKRSTRTRSVPATYLAACVRVLACACMRGLCVYRLACTSL